MAIRLGNPASVPWVPWIRFARVYGRGEVSSHCTMMVRPRAVLMIDVLMSPPLKSRFLNLGLLSLALFLAYRARPLAGEEKETSRPKVSSFRARLMYCATGPKPWVG